jgi:4-amino-4-deoxychorismate lyase
MTPRPDLVVTLDGRVHRADAAVVRADDPLFRRGDGVFETLLVRRGVPTLLDAHLARLGVSDDALWRRAVAVAVSAWGAADEGVLRMVHGDASGREEESKRLSFVTVSPVPDRVAAARRDGVAAVTLARRIVDGPWTTARMKSSSYAVNAAALRQAARMGADDAVFVAGGIVLEGPRSSVVAVVDGALLTPPSALPILPGTTVAALFGIAREHAVRCSETMMTVSDLLAAQSVWLLSAVTLAARVRALDGVELGVSEDVDVLGLIDAAVTLG